MAAAGAHGRCPRAAWRLYRRGRQRRVPDRLVDTEPVADGPQGQHKVCGTRLPRGSRCAARVSRCEPDVSGGEVEYRPEPPSVFVRWKPSGRRGVAWGAVEDLAGVPGTVVCRDGACSRLWAEDLASRECCDLFASGRAVADEAL